MDPIKKSHSKQATQSVETKQSDEVYQNPSWQNALDYMKTQESQTGEAEPVEETNEGPKHYIQTATELQEQIDQAQIEAAAAEEAAGGEAT